MPRQGLLRWSQVTGSPAHLLTCSPARLLTCSPAQLLACSPARLLSCSANTDDPSIYCFDLDNREIETIFFLLMSQ